MSKVLSVINEVLVTIILCALAAILGIMASDLITWSFS